MKVDNELIFSLLKRCSVNAKIESQSFIEEFLQLENCPYVEYQPWMMQYHNEYLNFADNEAGLHHFIIYLGQEPVGFFHFNILISNQKYHLLGNASGLMEPFLIKGLSRKQKRKILSNLYSFYVELAKSLKIGSIKFQSIFSQGYSEAWFSILSERVAPNFSQELYCDLSLSDDEYLQQIRASFKKHIKTANKLWQVKVIEQITDIEYKQVQDLHLQVVGFKTRSDLSWELLRLAINQGRAFLVSVYDKQQLLGCAIFSHTRSHAVYSMGVYDRAFFDKPISHIVHYQAICHMKQLGLDSYHLGSKCNEFELPTPSDKERAIGYFKEGFATQSQFKVTFDLNVSDLDQTA